MLLASMAFVGCYSIDDTQKEWTDKGETIYVGRLDSLKVRSGMNRVEIVGDTRYLRTAVTCEVKYNDKTLTYQIADVKGDDGKARMIVDNLEGGSYYFDIMTYDAVGNKSVPRQVYGVAYGEKDALVEAPRRISTFIPKPDGSLDIEWNDAEVTYSELDYENANGEIVTVEINDNQEITNVKSWKKGGAVKVRSYIRKKEVDLDMLALGELEYQFPEKIQESIPRFTAGSKMDMGLLSTWDIFGSFTLEVRARFTELPGGDQCIVSCEAGGPDSGFMLRTSGTNLQFYVGANGWQGVGIGGLQTGVWYDLAISYVANHRIRLYVNGELRAEGGVGTMVNSNRVIQAGTSPFYGNRVLRGDLQHLSIWGQERTPEQVKADVEQGYGFTSADSGLKAYWPLTVNYGSEVSDVTGQRTAVFTNVTWNEVK